MHFALSLSLTEKRGVWRPKVTVLAGKEVPFALGNSQILSPNERFGGLKYPTQIVVRYNQDIG